MSEELLDMCAKEITQLEIEVKGLQAKSIPLQKNVDSSKELLQKAEKDLQDNKKFVFY